MFYKNQNASSKISDKYLYYAMAIVILLFVFSITSMVVVGFVSGIYFLTLDSYGIQYAHPWQTISWSMAGMGVLWVVWSISLTQLRRTSQNRVKSY